MAPRPELAQACANAPGVQTSGSSPGYVTWVTQSLASQARLPDPPHGRSRVCDWGHGLPRALRGSAEDQTGIWVPRPRSCPSS